MKKISSTFLIYLLILGTTVAQNRNIIFEDETQTWAAILEKARDANKYVFLNKTAVWCGPCRVLARDVFTRDEVADFFNQNFINANFDIDRGEGRTLREKFSVSAVPTLMWINPRTGEVVHRVAGARDAEFLITQGEIALAGDNTSMNDLRARYERTQSTEDLQAYLSALGRAGMSQQQSRVVLEHLRGLTNEQLMDTTNWNLINRHVHDVLSEPLQQVFANRTQFSEVLGEERVDRKLRGALQASVSRLSNNRDTMPSPNFDETGYTALLEFMQTLDFPTAPLHVLQLRVIGYTQHEGYANMVDALNEIFKSNLMQGQTANAFYMRHLMRLTRTTDQSVRNKGIALIDDIIASVEQPQGKIPLLRFKGILLDRFGDAEGAEKARQEVQAIMQRQAGEGGGRMRATPMN